MRKTHLAYALSVVPAVLGAGFYFAASDVAEKPPTAARAAHESQFFNYAPLIERAAADAATTTVIGLGTVAGGLVPHHVPTTIPVLAEFYAVLKNTRPAVRTFIIIGPDHIDAGRGDASVSKAAFVTPFGTIEPDLPLIEALERSGIAVQDETPFPREHSIDAQTIFIAKFFPGARIVPVVIRSSMTVAAAEAFGRSLAAAAGDSVFVVASVDFSHYLTERQARPLDLLSLRAIESPDPGRAANAEADSTQSLVALAAFLEAREARANARINFFNTGDFGPNSDFTTGYVTGFWGTERGGSSDGGAAELLFVGDIMLSRHIGTLMERKADWFFPFRKMRDAIRAADIAVGNLEGPISSRGTSSGGAYSFRADPRAAAGLVDAGFDVLSVANNHIWDYGADAFADTLSILNENGIAAAGGGATHTAAHEPAIAAAGGMRIAFLGYTDLVPRARGEAGARPATAFLDETAMVRDIARVRQAADAVVVLLHWGDEYETHRSGRQSAIAHAAIDAGAILVVGHHPHVVQEVEEYRGGLIAYSLGNFVFDQNFSEDTKRGLALAVALRGGAVESFRLLPVSFTAEFQPYEAGR